MKVSLAAVLVITLVLAITVIDIADAYYSITPGSPPPPPPPSKHLQLKPGMPKFCPSKCVNRCKRNPRELCKKLCMHCCHKCKCVPDGPFGDKNKCPCYRDIKNKRGQSKCP